MSAGPGRVHDLRLLVPAGAAWVVVLVGLVLPPTTLVVAGLVLGVAALALVLPERGRRPAARVVALVLAACCLTLLAAGLHGAVREHGPVSALATGRATVRAEAVVVADPRPVVRPGRPPLVVVRVRLETVTARGRTTAVRTPVLVLGDPGWSRVHWHERVRLSGRLVAAERGDDVVALLRPTGPPRSLAPPGPLLRGVDAVRADLRRAVAGLPDDPRGLVPALVVGDTGRLPPGLVEDLRASGMTHLTAVSGANVTVVLIAAGWVCGLLGLGRRRRLPALLLALGLFVLLCRPEPSVVRAAVMGCVGLLATSAGRPRAALSALAAAVLVLLSLDPWLARSYGFALSALATLGLVLFARPWGQAIGRRLPRRLAGLGEALAVPLAAQATCGPVVVLLQGGVSLVGVPANLLAAPLVTPATLAGVLTACLAPVVPPLAAVTAWGAGLPAWGIALVGHAAARVPGGTLPWPDGLPGAALLALVTLAAVVLGPSAVRLLRARPWLAAAPVAVAVALLWPMPTPGWPARGWAYVACDVGQGDAGVLATDDGRAVLVDVGPDPDAVDRCLQRLGVQQVAAVVLTHFHADHVDGLAGALRGRQVAEIITTPVQDGGDAGGRDAPSHQPQVAAAARAAGIPVTVVRAGDRLSWPGVEASVLWPARRIDAGSVQNNASVVLDVTVREVRVLLLGDAEREAQTQVRSALLRAGGDRFDVLKVAHHGSSNMDPRLAATTGAGVAVISVGAGNDYGHPTPRLLDDLAAAGIPAVRTDQVGDVLVARRGGRLEVLHR